MVYMKFIPLFLLSLLVANCYDYHPNDPCLDSMTLIAVSNTEKETRETLAAVTYVVCAPQINEDRHYYD